MINADLFRPCIRASGPSDARIAFVGEAPGEQEELTGLPLMGKAGQEFTSLLQETGHERSECYLTNVLWTRPPGNDFKLFLVPKSLLTPRYSLIPIEPGKYLHPSLAPELDRLQSELRSLPRLNLVVALGAKAAWALVGDSRIGRCRGVVTESTLIPGLKVLPTYHPAALFRNWSWRTIVLQDFLKARREMEFPEIRRTERRLTISPTIHQVIDFEKEALRAPILSCDIETERRQITMVGFATSPSRAFVIPFWDKGKPNYSYWSEWNERLAWDVIGRILSSHPRLLFQNGMYDVQHFARMGLSVPGFTDDTMLLHHALYPEMPKGLEFLGSIYTNERSWKQLRPRHGAGETKREE